MAAGINNNQTNNQVIYQTETWVKRARYVLVELCACAMRHCLNSRFMIREPLEKLYPYAQEISETLSQALLGYNLSKEKIGEPLKKLVQAGAKPEDLSEFIEQLELFFGESLKNGFNAPLPPVQQILQGRFQTYLQEARTIAYGLQMQGSGQSTQVASGGIASSSFAERFFTSNSRA
jgi:hypothetical protein